MTNSKKDSELERVRAIFVKHTEDGLDTELELFDTDAIIEEIATNYITKEESDRRVLEGRIETELSMIDKLIDTYQQHGSLDDVFQVGDLYAMRMRIVKRQTLATRELLKGGEE